MKMKTLIPAIAMAVTPAAFAEDSNVYAKTQGFYAAPEIGRVHLNFDKDDDIGFGGFSFGGFGGYKFNEYIAAETGFNYVGGLEGKEEFEANFWNLKAGGRAFIPVSDTFSLTGKVGAHWWKLEHDFTDADVSDVKDDGVDAYLGIGINAAVKDNVSVSVDWTRYLIKSDKIEKEVLGFEKNLTADIFSVAAIISF